MLHNDAAVATAAYTTVQATYEATVERNDESLRAHGAAVEAHTLATAEFESAQANQTARSSCSRPTSVDRKETIDLLIATGVLCTAGRNRDHVCGRRARDRGRRHRRRSRGRGTTGGPNAGVGCFGGQAESGIPATPPVQPVPPRLEDVRAPSVPVPNARLMDIQVEIKTQEHAVAQHDERVANARAVAAGELAPPRNPQPCANWLDRSTTSTRRQSVCEPTTNGR